MQFKALMFLLLFLPPLVQIDIFSFSFALTRFRLRSERGIHTQPRRRTHVSNRRPSYGTKSTDQNKGIKNKSAGMAGVSIGDGLGDGLLVCSSAFA